jgi:hypothetical protein
VNEGAVVPQDATTEAFVTAVEAAVEAARPA